MNITATWSAGPGRSVTFDFQLDPGVTAFVDREWAGGRGAVPALLVDAAGAVAWWDGQAIRHRRPPPPAPAPDPGALAASAVAALAVAAVAALPSGCRGGVEVTGTGVVARTVAVVLGQPWAPGERAAGGAPAAVDTTGSTAEIMAVAQRLADRGTLVLSGPPGPDGGPADLYRDVHRRSLRFIGVPPLAEPAGGAGVTVAAPEPASRRRPAGDAPWYRLE